VQVLMVPVVAVAVVQAPIGKVELAVVQVY
jgi:hypothetical protein